MHYRIVAIDVETKFEPDSILLSIWCYADFGVHLGLETLDLDAIGLTDYMKLKPKDIVMAIPCYDEDGKLMTGVFF